MAIDRVGDWKKFSDEVMVPYLEKHTISKYGSFKEFDLMSVTSPIICVWQILKYAFRCYSGKGKTNDLQKIAHYAQLAYTISDGDLSKAGITNEKGD